MNAAERRTLFMALALLLLGWGARVVPASFCDNCGELTFSGAEQPDQPPAAMDSTEVSMVSTSVHTSVDRGTRKKSKALAGKGTLRGPIHINAASAADLQRIKGVGPVLAQKIVDYRTQHGVFRSGADLDKVPGIGKKKLDNLLSVLIFD